MTIKFKFVFLMLVLFASSCSGLSPKKYSRQEIKAESDRINAFFEKSFNDEAQRYPQFLTSLGSRDRYGELNDVSYEFAHEQLKRTKQELQDLKQFNYQALNTQSQLSYDLFKKSLLESIKSHTYFYHYYFVSQMFGHHTRLPSFMINQHLIASEKEALDYISRLVGFKKSFDQLLVNLKEQENLGIKMPYFSFDKMVNSSESIIAGYPFQKSKTESSLYQDFSAKIKKLKLADKKQKALLKAVEKALVGHVGPAYTEFIYYLKALKKRSPESHGVWAIPKGKDFYKFRLASQTNTDMTASEIHKVGLAEVARLHKEMKLIMKKVGFNPHLKLRCVSLIQNPKNLNLFTRF